MALVLVIAAVWAIFHVMGNLNAKPNPPAACQLWGGHWTLWSGWRCDG